MQKNHIDPILALAEFVDGDPGADAIPEIARENGEFFANCSTVEVPLPMTEVLGENSTDINTTRNKVISEVALGNMTVQEGMDFYNNTVGDKVAEVLESLNNPKTSGR